MKTADDNIQDLMHRIQECRLQIAALTAIQDQALSSLITLVDRTQSLHAARTNTMRQEQEMELRKSGLHIWENIGEGG